MIILLTKALRADAYTRLLARRTDGTPEAMAKEDARLGKMAAAIPTPAQAEAGNYRKRPVAWQGLTLKVENEAGSVRRGKDRDGKEWATKMPYAYGYVARSEGVDGDEVDVYLGPDLEGAGTVYVVHQRKKGAPDAVEWKGYDEDKVMLGFPDEAAARTAYLKCYDDPRFLGPITAMPVPEFVSKVKATKERPAMIKSQVLILFAKAHVGPYLRNGRLVNLAGYQGRGESARAADGQASLFGDEHGEVTPVKPASRETDSAHAEGDKWVMPIKDAIAEHAELVAALKSPGKADDREEIKEQGSELERMAAAVDESSPTRAPVLFFDSRAAVLHRA